MKAKFTLLIILFFSTQIALFAQDRRDTYKSNYKNLLNIAKKANWKYYNYINFTTTVKSDDLDVTLKGKKWVRVSMFHDFKCNAEFGLKSPKKILGLERNELKKSQGYTYQTLSFISNYNQKMTFWVKLDKTCNDSQGQGRIAIHYKDAK